MGAEKSLNKIIPNDAVLIPDNATRVFQGDIFDVYQWPQIMFDGSIKMFEMLKRPDTVQIIVVNGSKVLLIEEVQPGRDPRIHFPGGRADGGESTWEAAARRELREETGLECKKWRLVGVRQPIVKIEWFAPIFLVTDVAAEHEQEVDPGGEKIIASWYEFNDVRDRVLLGTEQMMQYLVPFFNRVKTLDELVSLPTFAGVEVDR